MVRTVVCVFTAISALVACAPTTGLDAAPSPAGQTAEVAGQLSPEAAELMFASWQGRFAGKGYVLQPSREMVEETFELTGSRNGEVLSLLSTINPPVAARYHDGGLILTGVTLDGERQIPVTISEYQTNADGSRWSWRGRWTQPWLDGRVYDFREAQSYERGEIVRFVEMSEPGSDGPWRTAYAVTFTRIAP